jgi:ADP-ribose pyrophosphatase
VDSGLAEGVHGLDHEGEDILVRVLSFAEAQAALFHQANSTSIIVGLQWLAQQREKLRHRWR